VGDEEGEKKINSYASKVSPWVVTFSFTRERMREGKTTKAERKEGGEGVGGK